MTLDELVRGEETYRRQNLCLPPLYTAGDTRRGKAPTIAGTALLAQRPVRSFLVLCLLLAGDLFADCCSHHRSSSAASSAGCEAAHCGLYRGWAVYLCVDFYLRFATGLSWTTIFATHRWTYEMNYTRLAIVAGTVLRYACDDRLHDAPYRALLGCPQRKRGYMAYRRLAPVLIVLPYDEPSGIMPLMPLTYSKFSPFSSSTFCIAMVRLALRQRFARAHTCHLAREAGSEERTAMRRRLRKYYTWSKYVAF